MVASYSLRMSSMDPARFVRFSTTLWIIPEPSSWRVILGSTIRRGVGYNSRYIEVRVIVVARGLASMSTVTIPTLKSQ
jgi:hypothetical protein